MSTDTATLPQEQTSLIDLSGQQVYADFYDDKSPVFLPNNPLHFKAHKLQKMVDALEVQAVRNPAQFNSKNYLEAVDALMNCYQQIKEDHNEVLEQERLAKLRDEGATGGVGETISSMLGTRISADNPIAG